MPSGTEVFSAANSQQPLVPIVLEAQKLRTGGLSNAEIGDRLVLVEGTVANHVAHIMRRLGPQSRTQIAVWAVSSAVSTVQATRRSGRRSGQFVVLLIAPSSRRWSLAARLTATPE